MLDWDSKLFMYKVNFVGIWRYFYTFQKMIIIVVIIICFSMCLLSIMGLYPYNYHHCIFFVVVKYVTTLLLYQKKLKHFTTLLNRMSVNLKGKRESSLIENQLGGQDCASRYELLLTYTVSLPSLQQSRYIIEIDGSNLQRK